MTLTIREIGLKCMPKVFPEAKHFITLGLKDTDDCTAEDAEEYLMRGNWQLLAAFNEENVISGAYVTTYNYAPTGKIGVIISAAGKGLLDKEVFEQVCTIAKSYGAVKIQALAKESAARLYRRVGFAEKAILVEKKLWAE